MDRTFCDRCKEPAPGPTWQLTLYNPSTHERPGLFRLDLCRPCALYVASSAGQAVAPEQAQPPKGFLRRLLGEENNDRRSG